MCSEYQPCFQDVQEASAPTKSPLEIDPKVHRRPCSLLPAPANGRNHQGDQSPPITGMKKHMEQGANLGSHGELLDATRMLLAFHLLCDVL